MGNVGRATLFKTKDAKYLLYLPTRLVGDSMFPLKCDKAMIVRISFKLGEDKLIIEKWKKTESPKA